ncbi:MAG: hypothetical protein Q7S09_04365 [bacterium]|nr:hypothetical protein [bacterium]
MSSLKIEQGRKILGMIGDKSVSDDAIYDAFVDYTKDRFDGQGELIIPTPEEIDFVEYLGGVARAERPEVMERLRKFISEMHKDCCGPFGPF